jgi:SAM-dependent methyltransferase
VAALTYRTLEKLSPPRPVDRVKYIVEACRARVVLDLGCMDETALFKRNTSYWLHGRIAEVAKRVVGLDNSRELPGEGLQTAANATVFPGDATYAHTIARRGADAEVIVAGEFIEHLGDPVAFLRMLRQSLPGRELIISTPNGPSLANLLMGLIRREPQHPDHLHVFSYKTLNTIFMRAGFEAWDIIPYKFYSPEIGARSQGASRLGIAAIERAIRCGEFLFPLLSFGYIVRTRA